MNRREFLPLFAIPFLPAVGAIAADYKVAKPKNNNKALIIIPLTGGPSQFETFDIHPDAQSDFQSLTGFIDTNVEGIRLGSNFNNLARLANKFTVVNGISHTDATHDSGFCACMTAYNVPASDNAVQKEPAFGSVISEVFGSNSENGMPSYILSDRLRHTGGVWLGIKSEPFLLSEEGVRNLTLSVDNERFERRLNFISKVEQNNALSKNVLPKSWSELRNLASTTLSGNTSKSFKIDLESDSVKSSFGVGKSNFGKNLLLARRLIEGGTKVVVIPNNGWDTHSNLIEQFSSIATELDLYLSVLIEDLIQRNVYKDVLIVLTGEFGRTPRLNKTMASPGRDHHPNSMSSLLIGGDYNHGGRVGKTGKDTNPIETPISHMDIFATILDHFGIDKTLTIVDQDKRPRHILSGNFRSLL